MHRGGGAGRRCHFLVNDQGRSQLLECKTKHSRGYLGGRESQAEGTTKGPRPEGRLLWLQGMEQREKIGGEAG